MTLRALAFRCCFRLACISGASAVHLGSAFRAIGRRSATHGLLVVLAQLPVVLLWATARAVFLASSAPCHALARDGAL